MTAELAGKTAVITGGNTGIGKETARGLAERGAKVVIACRNLDKGEHAKQDIVQTTGNTNVELVPLDLSSFASIRTCAERLQRDLSRIDIFIANAGVVPRRLEKTADGFEAQIGVNHLGHFLLTNLLLDSIRNSEPARITVVSSTMHRFGKIDFDSFRQPKRYNFMRAYCQSKLANVLFSNELARRLQGSRISVNALHPGPIRTEIYRDFPQPFRALILAPLLTPKQGAKTSLHVAVSEEGNRISGGYFAGSKLTKTSKRARDAQLAQTLWQKSAELCGC